MEMDNTEILTTESRWFEKGVIEAIFITALNPSLNRDSGRCILPPVMDSITKKSESREAEEGVPRHHRHAQCPQ